MLKISLLLRNMETSRAKITRELLGFTMQHFQDIDFI